MVMKKYGARIQSILEFTTLLVIVVVGNILGNFYYLRIDLTEEKRYTLSETSKKLSNELKEKCYFRLYLDGDMSARFKNLRNEIRDMAYEFRELSGRKIEIEIIDPFEDKQLSEVSSILDDFNQRGVMHQRDIEGEGGNSTTIKNIIPGAEMMYAGKTVAINFYEHDVALDADNNIKRAIDNVEYEIANGLRQCTLEKPKKIAVADGSGEMIDNRVGDFAAELGKYYDVSALNINVADPKSAEPFTDKLKSISNPEEMGSVLMNSLQQRLNNNDLLLIIKPAKDYSPAELYLIDQFLLKGGKVIWMIDPVHVEIDSFETHSSIAAMDNQLENINASLFHYGVKLESTLLMDANCNQIPIPVGNRPEMIDFYYFPVFMSVGSPHIINKNVGPVWGQFPATLATKSKTDLNVTPLLSSSPYTKTIQAPANVDLENAYMQSRDDRFRSTLRGGSKITGVLMEGKFESPFIYQKHYTGLAFLTNGQSKMVVIADGDIVRNGVSGRGGIYPTGYDKFTKTTFANKKFMLNCIDYLIDENGLIEIRAKEKTLRLLDSEKTRLEHTYWQWFNIIAPLLSMVIFGLINNIYRKRKYQIR
ncbi:MAG: gliding motility-associated ABC transporter substrate-binding protein GldG [Flavobacteriaceae bacterium]|nr:gliding motility-associated ABC transporter substrate-binding protein GldG [Flavobacteriaceae bacterium]PHX76723.1 MAG: gliding motility-associated ABC transporter substrate-binding protein GldG [Flavobacteriales bacterium]